VLIFCCQVRDYVPNWTGVGHKLPCEQCHWNATSVPWTRLTTNRVDWVKALRPIRRKIGNFADVLPNRSLGLVLKKNCVYRRKTSYAEHSGLHYNRRTRNLNKYNSLLQMDPRDGLPHLHRGVHRGKRPVRSTGQARRSYVDRRKYCQLRPTTVASLSHWAATLAELSWRHVATINGSGESFWVHGTNFQNEVPPFLEIPKFLYNIV